MRRVIVTLVGAVALVPLASVARATPAPPAAEKRALVIVVNRYTPPTKLAGGPRDADDVRQALLENGWPDGNIRMLVDGAATAANIREGLRWLAGNSTDRSFSVMHYSGHVKQKPGDVDHDGEVNDEFLWSYDNVHIPDAELGRAMRDVKGDSWTDISGCEAAGFNDGIAGPRRLFTGSSQESEQSHADLGGNSVFTGLMVRDALRNHIGDANGDGAVSIQEAFAHAASEAPIRTAGDKGGPQHPYIAGGDGSEWFLQPARAAAKAALLPEPVRDLPVVKDLPVVNDVQPPAPTAPALPPPPPVAAPPLPPLPVPVPPLPPLPVL
jgi:hypothetical protein